MADIEPPMADVEAEDALDAWLAGHAAELATEAARDAAEREADCLAAWSTEELAAQVQAAATELASSCKAPTAWQIAARAVQLGAPYERREDVLRLAQGLAAPPAPPAAAKPRLARRSKEVMAREIACREQAALLVEAARELDELAEELYEQYDALDEAEADEDLLRRSARLGRLAEAVSAAADDLEADRADL